MTHDWNGLLLRRTKVAVSAVRKLKGIASNEDSTTTNHSQSAPRNHVPLLPLALGLGSVVGLCDSEQDI